MILIRRFTLFVFAFLTLTVWSQSTEKYSGVYADFYRAEELFEKEQYSAARKIFSSFLENFQDRENPLYVKARYYEGLSALELYHNDAVKLLLTFVNEYPESIYKNKIYFNIGESFYQQKKYKDAKEWFVKTDVREIDTVSRASYHFKLGYSYFQLEEYSLARNEFYDIKDGNSNYGPPAMYYYSYIAYKNKVYQEALDGFYTLEENPVFEKEVPYYIVQIYYLQGDYQKVVNYAARYLEKYTDHSDAPAEISLLIGDSYYRIKNYEKAIPFLENYNAKKQTTRDEDYVLAYSYFKEKQYDKAIKLFDRVSKTKDKLGQVSLYHIAEAYKYKKELNYARTAFHSASNLDFDKTLQEDALYNYAVLSYELDYNPYNEAIKAFEMFLSKFPDSDRKEDVYSYLVNVYSSTKNYEEAIKSLNRIPTLNIKLKTAYQVVSFNMGIEKYERRDYQGAVKALKEVGKYDVSPSLTGKAKFWEADAYFMLAEWSEAIKGFRAFLTTPGINDLSLKESAYYNIAYAYFLQKDWVQAIQSFRTFTHLSNIQDEAKVADAYARIGDAYFTMEEPDFQKSILNYQQALNYKGNQKDKTLYAMANVYKRMPGKREEQIKTLENLLSNYKNSSYTIPAIFDIARGYKNNGEYQKALVNFNTIVNDYPNNILVKDAIVEIADVKFKQNEYKEAESYYKRVLNEYSLDDLTCKRVVKGIVDIYRVMRRQDEIVQLGRQYSCADISEDDEEVFYYETASELYVNDKYSEAIPELKKYLERYPKGRFSVQLTSYLAEIYYQRGEMQEAMSYYQEIINQPNSAYTEEALIRSSKYFYNNTQYNQAVKAYEKLEQLSSNPQVIFNTRVGLMRSYFILKNYEKAIQAAKKVLKDELLTEVVIRVEANYIEGMSNFYIEKFDQAIDYLRWTADNTGAERGTEALYYLTATYFNLNEYSKAEELHNELLKRKPAYNYWIARSLILQAKVFMVTDDLFQAEQTIDLIIKNYPEKDSDVIEEAEKVRSEILQLKDTPKETEEDFDRVINLDDENED